MPSTDGHHILRFSKITQNAYAPTKSSTRAAGFDLKSAYNYTVLARGVQLIKTDIRIQMPIGSYGRIAPRSGLAINNSIDVGAGVVDEDYRGNVGIVLFNHSAINFEIRKGDRIAQLICEKIYYPLIEEIPFMNDTTTTRGSNGFGSSGIQ